MIERRIGQQTTSSLVHFLAPQGTVFGAQESQSKWSLNTSTKPTRFPSFFVPFQSTLTLLLHPFSPNQVLIMLLPCLAPSMALHCLLNRGQAPLCSIFPGRTACSGPSAIYNPIPHDSPTFVPNASQNRLFVFFLTNPMSFVF